MGDFDRPGVRIWASNNRRSMSPGANDRMRAARSRTWAARSGDRARLAMAAASRLFGGEERQTRSDAGAVFQVTGAAGLSALGCVGDLDGVPQVASGGLTGA